MTTITIKDLAESVELDRQAMRAVCGGARFGGGQFFRGHAKPSAGRLIDYPGGIVTPAAMALPAIDKPLK